MLFFIKEENTSIISGYTKTTDETPGLSDSRYVRWDAINVSPAFQSEQDAEERSDECIEKVVDESGNLTDPPPLPPKFTNVLSVLEFRNRFTATEKSAIYTAAETDVLVRSFLDDLSLAEFVDVTDPNTINGVAYLIGTGAVNGARESALLAQKQI